MSIKTTASGLLQYMFNITGLGAQKSATVVIVDADTGEPVNMNIAASMSTVARTGQFVDLLGTPTMFSGAYADLSGKPVLFSGLYSDLAGRPGLATVATSGAYSDLSGRPGLSTVATTGVYSDLSGRPTLFSGVYADLSGKPALFSGAYADLTGKPAAPILVQRARLQTDTNGLVTWTYPVPYPAGSPPVLSADVEDATTGASWAIKFVSRTETSVTVQLTKTQAVTVLNISVLGLSTNPQAYVHFIAVPA